MNLNLLLELAVRSLMTLLILCAAVVAGKVAYRSVIWVGKSFAWLLKHVIEFGTAQPTEVQWALDRRTWAVGVVWEWLHQCGLRDGEKTSQTTGVQLMHRDDLLVLIVPVPCLMLRIRIKGEPSPIAPKGALVPFVLIGGAPKGTAGVAGKPSSFNPENN